jgi:hypothetical protein
MDYAARKIGLNAFLAISFESKHSGLEDIESIALSKGD